MYLNFIFLNSQGIVKEASREVDGGSSVLIYKDKVTKFTTKQAKVSKRFKSVEKMQ